MHPSKLALLMFGVLGTACHHSRGGSPPPLVTVTVVATVPGNGATDVEPDAVVTVSLANASQTLLADDLIVRDGGNRLPGTVARVGATADWTWTPDIQLPRGASVTLGTAQQGVLATFGVREAGAGVEYELPGEQVASTVCWSNGRRAVRTRSGRVFEVMATGLVERFVAMPAGARSFGDGSFVGEVDDLGVHHCVRGNLDGTLDRVPTPLGVAIGEHNDAGDVVAFVPASLGVTAEQGLWRLMHTSVAWDLAGPLVLDDVRDRPSIGDQGVVALAYRLPGLVRVSRFAVGDLAGQHDDLAIDTTEIQYDFGPDGRGVLALGVPEVAPPGGEDRLVVRAARHEPGVGLQLLPQELQSWITSISSIPESLPFSRVDDVQVGDYGSAAIVLARGATSIILAPGETNTFYEVVRLEPDGAVGGVTPLPMVLESLDPAAARFGGVGVTPRRAEVWGVSSIEAPNGVLWSRSRPDATALRGIYDFAVGIRVYGDWDFAADDSGRAVLAIDEFDLLGTLLGSRVIAID